jgi:hypothetical protein
MRWAVEIQNTNLEKRNLTDLLYGLGFDLVDGVEYPALHSSAIDACTTAADAFKIAKGVRFAFTGPAMIDNGFVLGSVIDFSTTPPHRHAFLEGRAIITTISFGSPTLTVSPSKDISAAELARCNAERIEKEYQAKLERQRAFLEPAFLNPIAAKVIELLSIVNPTGKILYDIFELVVGNKNERQRFHEHGITENEYNRFRDAVHNPSVHGGDWARHRIQLCQLRSPNPMSKNESEAFVRKIAIAWLNDIRNSNTSNELDSD